MGAIKNLVIGVDASTTALKVIVWDRQGQVVSEGRQPIELEQPHPAWHEQPAEGWRQAFCAASRAALSGIELERLAAVCIAHQRETFVLVDEQGQPLRPAIVWMDERARPLLAELVGIYGAEAFHRWTGKPLSGNLLPGKLAWIRQHEPDVFQRIHKVLDVHAYLVHLLTGQFKTSYASADPMGLFDMQAGDWGGEVLAPLGMSAAQMPQAFAPGTILGEVSGTAERVCGMPEGLPVVAGLGDGQAGGLGANATHSGEAYLNLGTAVVSGTLTREYQTSRAFRTHYAGIPGSYSLETVILGGTYTIRWFVEQFGESFSQAGRVTEEVLEGHARAVTPGTNGLMLVPYWNTALNPYWDAGASGIMVGWRGLHTPVHMYRAILEGIAYEQRLATTGVEEAVGEPTDRYIAFGGGARSSLWCQILADVTGKTVHLAHAPEATALGAGILAASASGLYADIPQAAQAMTRRLPQAFKPDFERWQLYNKFYEVYKNLYPALQTHLSRLTGLAETEAG